MTCRLLLSAFLAIAFCSAQQTNAQDLQRGLKNYQEIIGGKKKLEQLSPQEQQEVFIINKRVRNSTGSSECRNAKNQAESAASDLANYARRLRNCAEAQDYSDDCSSEFSRARSAHSDYEDAVSSVGNYCR